MTKWKSMEKSIAKKFSFDFRQLLQRKVLQKSSQKSSHLNSDDVSRARFRKKVLYLPQGRRRLCFLSYTLLLRLRDLQKKILKHMKEIILEAIVSMLQWKGLSLFDVDHFRKRHPVTQAEMIAWLKMISTWKQGGLFMFDDDTCRKKHLTKETSHERNI